ncbi:MAG: LPS assembly lipoprotein LptE [Neisseria sp.]|nr:LPS assembly lipoprotein LptE [Neisseria sp.]
MNKIFSLAFVLALSSCGFHLKGAAPYDRLPVQEWHIPAGALKQPLETALRQASGVPSEYANRGASLVINHMNEQRDVITITRAAQINEYLLMLNVNAQAYYQGKAWGEPMQIQVRRTMDYADSQILGKQEEEAQIWREMRQDAAAQIVRRLAFLKAQ